MPSPFPGMDPYLEGSNWTSVHSDLISQVGRQLAPLVRPKYIVRTTRRFVTDTFEGVSVASESIIPDVGLFQKEERDILISQAVAAIAPAPIQLATVVPTPVPLLTVEIRDVTNRDLITCIEVLSPTNKRDDGYQEYVEKRSRVLRSTAHLLEIDLLRQGKRVPTQRPLPSAPYFVFLSRSERHPFMDVWPIDLPMRLPIVPVPLLPGDPDVALDIQLALDTIYDTLGYDLSVDYTRSPEIPLEGAAADWAATHIRRTQMSG